MTLFTWRRWLKQTLCRSRRPGRKVPRPLWVEALEARTVPSFAAAVFAPAGPSASGLAVADFNHDGDQDVAVANDLGGSGTVSILLGNGDGTFAAPVSYPTGHGCLAVAVGDFNGDTIPDLVAVNERSAFGETDGSLTILLGNGDGTFRVVNNIPESEVPNAAFVADFNNDGKQDIGVANFYGESISIYRGNGDGTFQGPVDYAATGFVNRATLGDLNGDGQPDIVVDSRSGLGGTEGTDGINVFLGNPDGTFQARKSQFSAGGDPYAVAVGNFNGDTRQDVATVAFFSGTLNVLPGNGDGTLQPALSRSGDGSEPNYLAVGDFNSDGKLDAVAAHNNANYLSVFPGNGDGSFQSPVRYNLGAAQDFVGVADFNNDGLPDLVASVGSANNIAVLLNQYPVPAVTGTDVTSVPEGSAAFTLTVTGSNFASAAVVRWNGTALATTFVSSGQLQTIVPTSLLADETVAAITVVNPNTAPSNAVNFTVTEVGSLAPAPRTFSATEGQAFSGPVAAFTDTNAAAQASDFSAVIFWGDGSSSVVTVGGGSGTFTVSGSHTYAADASYPVRVVLSEDAPGTLTATATSTALVAEDDVPAMTGAGLSAPEGTTLGGTVATFTDGNPAAQAGDFTAAIDWGDGTSSPGSVSGANGSFTITGSHSYAGDEATYAVTVTVTDAADTDGGLAPAPSATGTGSATLTEADQLAGSAATLAAVEGVPFGTQVAGFTSTYTGSPAGDFTATILWGDGTSSLGTIAGMAGRSTVSGSHVYIDEGTYSPSVFIADDGGGTATLLLAGSAVVADNDTVLDQANTVNATEGATFTGQVGTFTDTSYPSHPVGDFTVLISWGDGTTSAGTVASLGGGNFAVSGSHTYADDGSYPVQLTVLDDGRVLASAGSTATVANGDVLTPGGLTLAATEGQTLAATVATFTDSLTTAAAGSFTAGIDWGDGTVTAGTVTGGGGTFTVAGSHTYAEENAAGYTVRVTLADVNNTGQATVLATATSTAVVADAPLAVTGSVLAGTEGATLSAVVASFTDPGGDGTTADYRATILWGDGGSSAGTVGAAGAGFGVTGSHAYAEEGSYAVRVLLTDAGSPGATVTATGSAAVTDAPLSATLASLAATEGVTLSGAVATFTDGDPAGTAGDCTATISWGDGLTSAGAIGTGAGSFTVSGSHAYAEEGSHAVRVVIQDAGGASATATGQVGVADAALTPGAVNLAATEGLAWDGVVVHFTDADPAGDTADYRDTIFWGDGSSAVGTIVADGSGGFAVGASHVYAEEGRYTVRVVLGDAGGATGTATGTAVVADAPLAMTATALTGTEGAPLSGVVATFTDPGSDGTAADYRSTILWGDGASSAGTLALAGAGFSVTGSHAYAEEGGYAVRVLVSDAGSPGTSFTATGSAVIADAALGATGAALSGTEGAALSGVVATFTDADPAAAPGDYSASIAWGDGLTGTGTVAPGGAGFGVSGTHVYAAEGSYVLRVIITDAGGAAAAATGGAAVADAPLTPGPAGLAATENAAWGGLVAHFTDADPGAETGEFRDTIFWGDGSSVTGTVVADGAGGFAVGANHTYAEEGLYPLSVVIQDVGGSVTTATGTAVVTDASLAATGAALAGTEGAPLSGVVATISDPGSDGTTADYAATILWGDGVTSAGSVGPSGGGFTVMGSHVYAEEGGYTVRVLLSDAGSPGVTITATGSAAVADAPLSATLASLTGTEGVTLSGVVASFTDADPAGRAGDYTAAILWGDGLSSPGTVNASGASFTVSGSHAYAEEGNYPISVIVADNGTGATAAGVVHVGDAPLRMSDPDWSTTEGAAWSGVVADFTDADPGAVAADFRDTIIWGDGGATNGTVVADGTGGFAVAGTHTYARAGSYGVTVIVSDAGGTTATATYTAQVADAPLTPTAVSLNATEGATLAGVVASFTDGNPGAAAGDFAARIDWGDNTITPGTVAASGGGFAVSGSHVYGEDGSYAVRIRITDVSGASATATGMAVVAEAPLAGTGAAVTAYEYGALSGTTTVANFSHGSNTEPAAALSASIDWGDGTSPIAGTVVASGGGYAVEGGHTYTDEGTYTVTVTVSDDAAAATFTATATVLEELLPDGTRGTADQRFVSEIYRDLLGRPVDPSGLASATAALAAGMSPALLVANLEKSAEYRMDTVQALYARYLHRPADPQGLQGAMDYLAAGGTDEQLAALLVSSAEYFQTRGGGSNDGFLDALYGDALGAGRTIDPTGRAQVDAALAAGSITRTQVAVAVFASTEYRQDLVQGLYLHFLDRPADAPGLAGWVTGLRMGLTDEQVIAGIIGSPSMEFYRKTAF